jgi:proteasome lid subunit RPN8/RPN11
LLFLRDLGPTEIGGFGVTPPDDLLYVEDVRLVRQSCTGTSVAFDDTAVAEFFDDQVDAGRRPEQFARVWVHTHPGECPWPSGVDERTFADVFGRCDWSVMFILANGGRTYARLQFRAGPGAQVRMPVQIDWGRAFAGADEQAWETEYMANVRPHEWGADWERRVLEERMLDEPLLEPAQIDPRDDLLTRRLHEALSNDQRLEAP